MQDFLFFVPKNQGKGEVVMTEPAEIIKASIKKDGTMTFRDYMEQALYHPQAGYYTVHQDRLGREGDFYTSVHVSYLFGAMLARQVAEMYRIMGCPQPFIVIEFGAGDGMLARDILSWLAGKHRDCFQDLQYRIVEISARLVTRQQATLAEYVHKVNWVDKKELIRQGPVDGVALSNELIDAFPVHLLKYSSRGWQEAWVDIDREGKLAKRWQGPSRDFHDYFALLAWQPRQEGQVVEANLAALDWLEAVASILQRGFVITIDYGYLVEELDDPRFLDGTLLCYYRHKVVNDPLSNVGWQDITSHANFTALMAGGKQLALETTAFMSQSKFLLNLGIMQAVEEMAGEDTGEAHKQALAVKKLAFPGGMGETFKVLIQHKNITEPRLRCLVPFHKQLR